MMPVAARPLAPLETRRFPVYTWIGGLVLLVLVFGLYAGSIEAPFVFDDAGAVTSNPTIRRLWSVDVLRPPVDGSTTTGRPMANISFALNYAISGEEVWSYHLLNIAIHACCVLLLFGIVRRTLVVVRSSKTHLNLRYCRRPGLVAFLVALVWAVHPLDTESVVCTAQRTESLCAFFYLLTVYAFVRSFGPPGSGNPEGPVRASPGEPGVVGAPKISEAKISDSGAWPIVAFVACLFGMATKEVMVTAPIMVLLFDRTFFAGSFLGACRRRAGFYVALGATWLVLAVLLWEGAGVRGASAGFGLGVSPWRYLLTQADALTIYLKLVVWPHPLVFDYGTGLVRSIGAVAWQLTLVLALLAGVIFALVRRPVLGFFGTAFFLLLAPSSSFVPLVTQTMAEHRLYLPLAFLIAPAVVVLAGRRGFVPVLLIIALSGLTLVRLRDYRDPLTLWSDTVAKYPANARGHNNLALLLGERGHPDAADTEFARAVALDPAYVTARYDWGVALLRQGRVERAIEQLKTAVALAPNHTDARVNLGNAFVRAGRAPEAVGHYVAALRLHPAPDIYYDLGVALLNADHPQEAAPQFQSAIALQPNFVLAHYQLGIAADRIGDAVAAKQAWLEVLRLAPDHVDALRHLGILAAKTRDWPVAADRFRAVIRLAPGDADARANLGNVLLLSGHSDEAIASYEAALRLRPGDLRIQESLDLAREATHEQVVLPPGNP